MNSNHFISATCLGEKCFCGEPATHKIGEEIPFDDPFPNRHNLTSYCCFYHFAIIFGPMAERICGLLKEDELQTKKTT